MNATAADLKAAMQALGTVWRADYSRDLVERLARVQAYLTRAAAELDRNDLVFRPVGDAWELGYARSPVVLRYPHRQEPLQAVHSAFAAPGRVVDLTAFVNASGSPSCAAAGSAIRNALRQRLIPWLKRHVDCPELVGAVKLIKISNETYASYDPACDASKITT